ncbi:MAG: ATP-binding protein [Clostridia bacterium]|nr:ATP-binding protein [Clostridia bacterium]
MKVIEREYLKELISVMGTPDVKIITGVRRSGKSKLLEEFQKYIKKNIEDYNIISINFNSLKYEKLKEYHELNEYIESKHIEGMKNFVLIDEVQMCDGFERTINSLHASEKYDIYITGSNAFLLSSDLATLFTGRTFEIELFPFSFKEFLKYYKYTDIDEAFKKYILEGGMSGSYLYDDENEKYKYILEVYKTLILRDINEKYKIRNEDLLDSLTNFMMDNISNITSVRNITNSLKKADDTLNHKTIGSYIQYLCNAFLFYKVRRYDIQGKRYLESQDKYYLVDPTFKYAKLGRKNMNYGRNYENIVAIELLRRGYEIYVGELYNCEVDFVAMRRDEKIYIQVADNIDDDKTIEREVRPLLKIKDAYPKIIIARTKHDDYTYEGIIIKDIANWLAKEE